MPTDAVADISGQNEGPDPSKVHESYDCMSGEWQMCRDLAGGEKAMKGERVKNYLTPLDGHKDSVKGGPDAYRQYVGRAYFFGAYGRTVDGLAGLVNQVDASVKLPKVMEADFQEDVDGQGTSVVEFCAAVVEELVKIGRVGVLVDWPMDDGKTRSKAEEEEEARRPFLTMYTAESILNWRVRRRGAKAKLVRVVVRESEEEESESDEFADKKSDQVRVFDLDREGNYRIRKFRQVKQLDGKTRWTVISEVYPTIGEGGVRKRMREVQFEILNHAGCGCAVRKPPLLDLAYVCVAHFRNAADYENGLHLTGFPQAYMNKMAGEGQRGDPDPTLPPGVTASKEQVYRVGDGTVWQFDGDVEVKAVPFTNELLGLERALGAKRQDMVVLGARMLANEKAAAEAAKTEEIRRQPENSALAKIAKAGSRGLQRVLELVAAWMKIANPKIKVELNTNFFERDMSPTDLLALVEAVQMGAIATSDLRWLIRRGNLLRAGRTDEEIDAELEAAGMPMSGNKPPVVEDPVDINEVDDETQDPKGGE